MRPAVAAGGRGAMMRLWFPVDGADKERGGLSRSASQRRGETMAT